MFFAGTAHAACPGPVYNKTCNYMDGGADTDQVCGGNDDDDINGGAGNDTMYSGAGYIANQFVDGGADTNACGNNSYATLTNCTTSSITSCPW